MDNLNDLMKMIVAAETIKMCEKTKRGLVGIVSAGLYLFGQDDKSNIEDAKSIYKAVLKNSFESISDKEFEQIYYEYKKIFAGCEAKEKEKEVNEGKGNWADIETIIKDILK